MRGALIGFCILTFVAYLTNAKIAPLPHSVRVRRSLTYADKESCKSTDKGAWRCKDCNTIQLCNNGQADMTLTCATQVPGKPYCDASDTITQLADKCVSDGKVCQGGTTDFICPGDGIYPSLTDCKSYFTCDQGTATQYMCLYGTIYNHAEKFCKPKAVCYDVKTDCGNQNKIIAYKQSKNLYVLCKANNASTLKECEENSVYNANLFRCEFQCPKEGIFADPDSEEKFYRCFNDGKVLQKDLEDCAAGSKFDKEKKYCVKSSGTTGGGDGSGGGAGSGVTSPTTTTKNPSDAP